MPDTALLPMVGFKAALFIHTYLHTAEIRPLEPHVLEEPYNTLVKAFSSYGNVDLEQFRPLISYLQRMSVPEGFILWKQDDPADGLYIIEAGVLRASYTFSDHTQSIHESMVPGTLAGELSALANLPRNASVVVERPAVLWKLTIQNLRRLETKEPALARIFTQMVLKCAYFAMSTLFEVLNCASAAKIDSDILLSALASRQ